MPSFPLLSGNVSVTPSGGGGSGGGATGVPEAPNDGTAYVRKSDAWVNPDVTDVSNAASKPPASAPLLATATDKSFSAIAIGTNLAVDSGALHTSASPTFSSVQIGTRTYVTEFGGDTWITTNAYYDGTNWQRVNIGQAAFALNFQSNNNIPGVSNTKGIIFWRATAAANPISSTFGSVGGWEILDSRTEYKDLIAGGFGLEINGNGTTPHGRMVHYSTTGSAPVWTGIVKNLLANMGNVDDSTKPSWFAGIKDDSFVVERAVAGQTTSAGLGPLLTVDNAGNMTIAGNPPGGSPPVSAPLIGTTSTGAWQKVNLGTNLSLSGTTLNASGTSVTTAYNTLDVTNATYGGKLNGIQRTTGAISSGTATFTDSNGTFVSTDIGKTIAIVGAGASSGHLVTTISAVSSTTSITLAANAGTTVSNAYYTYGTDDTAAWQAVLNAAAAAGGATIIAPAGISVIAGALQTGGTGTYNAQVKLPLHADPLPISIQIIGPYPPASPQAWVSPPSTSGLIIFSTLATTSGTRPACFGSPQAPGGFANMSALRMFWRNIMFRTLPNPAICMLDLSRIGSASVLDCQFDTLTNVTLMTSAPSNTNGVGMYCTGRGNQCAWSVERLYIQGYYTGIVSGEAGYINNVFSYTCVQGFSNPAVDYPTAYGLAIWSWCNYGMVWTGAHHCVIQNVMTEHWQSSMTPGNTWMLPVADFYDGPNTGAITYYWLGRCYSFYEVKAGVGQDGECLITGCVQATVTPCPASLGDIQPWVTADVTLGTSLAYVTNYQVSIASGGDIDFIIAPVISVNSVSGALRLLFKIWDVTAAAFVKMPGYGSGNSYDLVWCIQDTLPASTTRIMSPTKTFRVRLQGGGLRQYRLYGSADDGSGGAFSGTSVVIRSGAFVNGGTEFAFRGGI